MFKTGLVAAISIFANSALLAQTGNDAMRSSPGKNAAHGHSTVESRSAKSGAAKSELRESESRKSSINKSCAQFGPGFVRAEGSDTCVRIGGSIGIGVGGGYGRSGGMR